MVTARTATTPEQRAIAKSREIDPNLWRVVQTAIGEYSVMGEHSEYTVRVSAAGYSCDCPAGANGRPACWHRASCFRYRLSHRALRPVSSSSVAVKPLAAGEAKRDLWG
jgi:hypothetical protein